MRNITTHEVFVHTESGKRYRIRVVGEPQLVTHNPDNLSACLHILHADGRVAGAVWNVSAVIEIVRLTAANRLGGPDPQSDPETAAGATQRPDEGPSPFDCDLPGCELTYRHGHGTD